MKNYWSIRDVFKKYGEFWNSADCVYLIFDLRWNSRLSLTPTSSAMLNAKQIFYSCFAHTCFGCVLDFCPFEKMHHSICIKFCVKNKIKCTDAFHLLILAYGEATLVQNNIYRWYKMFSDRRDANDSVSDAQACQQQAKALMTWRK